MRLVIPWYQRFQFEVGGRWQMMPSRDVPWKEWLWSPFAGLTWPGKTPVGRNDVPNGEIFGGLESNEDKTFRALIWWGRIGIRICGLDVGIGLFFRPKVSVDKLMKGVK